MAELIALAKEIAALSVPALLALFILLLVFGKLRLEREVTVAEKDAGEAEAQRASDLAYRETLRQEAIADRKASDDRVARLTTAIEESNKLTRQSIELTEKIVNEALNARRSGRAP